jgi:hypothetical protein
MKYSIVIFLFLSANVFSQRIVDKDMGSFNEIKVFDLIAVNLIKSDENKVLIKGDNVDDINLINKNGVLKIRMELDKSFHGENTFVEVHYSHLDVIDGNEGAKISSNETIVQNAIELKAQEGAQIKVGLDISYLTVRSVTGGIVQASGISKNQSVVLNTGGIYEGKELRTEIASIKISAGGEAEIFATESADLKVKAGGDIDVYGNPKNVTKNTFVGGDINIRD